MLLKKTSNLVTKQVLLNVSRGIRLPHYDPAAAIPMKWGGVYMGVFMGFWGLCYLVNPLRERHVMMDTYESKWKKEN